MSWYLLFLNRGRSFHINTDGHTLGSLDVLNQIDSTIAATDIDSDNHTLASIAGFFFLSFFGVLFSIWTHFTQL